MPLARRRVAFASAVCAPALAGSAKRAYTFFFGASIAQVTVSHKIH